LGRARWKIENEAFNVMKNHCYELEHNFGHGETFLAMMLAALNLLAFAWHAALDLLEPPWQAASEGAAKRTSFLAHLLTLTTYLCRLSLMGGLPRSPDHLHHPPGTTQNPQNRMKPRRQLLLELLAPSMLEPSWCHSCSGSARKLGRSATTVFGLWGLRSARHDAVVGG
jgi:hypothetical protein